MDQYCGQNEVKDLPAGFVLWTKSNKHRIQNAERLRTAPYWIRDNKSWMRQSVRQTVLERARVRHEARTQEQIQDIRRRWDERNQNQLYKTWSADDFKQEGFATDVTWEEYSQIDGAGRKDAGYIQTPNSFSINEKLRSQDTLGDDDWKTIQTIDELTSRNVLRKSAKLYRMEDYGFVDFLAGKSAKSTELYEVLEGCIGMEIKDLGFRSTSVVEGANQFKDRPIRVNINAKAGTHAFVTLNVGESEVILPRGSSIKVRSVRKKGSYIILDCDLC